MTAVWYTLAALAGSLLYLYGRYAWAYVLCLFATQAWRFVSEFLRSDYRGDRKISAYQIMSLLTIPYGLSIPFLFPFARPGNRSYGRPGLLWNPALIVFLQLAGVGMFVHTGRSRVTGSGLSFHVRQDHI